MSCRETNSHAFTPKHIHFNIVRFFARFLFSPFLTYVFLIHLYGLCMCVLVYVSIYVLVLVSCILCMQHSCKTYLQMLHSI